MHQTGCHRRFAVVKDVNLLYRCIATVDIVELQLILIEHQTVHRERIGAREVLCIGDDDATHREPDWRFRAVTGNSSHLIEMAQLTGIIGHLDRELLTGRDLTGIVDSRTAAVGFDTLDHEAAMPLVLHFEGGGDGLLIASATALDGCLFNIQFLSRCRQDGR